MPSDRSRLSDRPRHLMPASSPNRAASSWIATSMICRTSSSRASPPTFATSSGRAARRTTGSASARPTPRRAPGFWSPPEPATASPPEASGQRRRFSDRRRLDVSRRPSRRVPAKAGRPGGHLQLPRPAGLARCRTRSPADLAQELVYLDAVLQEVSAVEDPDLLEVALGGPDTVAAAAASCPGSSARRSTPRIAPRHGSRRSRKWAAQGLTFDPATMRLSPAARLQVTFTEDASTGDPCDPTATGGYLGADNQLIRVQISAPSGTAPSLVWGYDNASFIYRITSVSPDGTTLTLASDPPDAFHTPQTGQIVEILTTGSVIAAEPDETDPTGVKRRSCGCAAEAVGEFHDLAQPYGPLTQGDPTSYIVLSEPVGAAIAASALPLFLRVWQAQLP